jgi:hypothetical protein
VGALLWILTAAAVAGVPSARSSPSDTQASIAKPEVNLTKLGVSYWQIEEPTGNVDAIVTIDDSTIQYSGACAAAAFPYRQHWESEGQLEVFPAYMLATTCVDRSLEAMSGFYFALRQANSVKGSSADGGQGLAFIWASKPLLHLERFEPEGLETRRWRITFFSNGTRMVTPKTLPTITFQHGQLRGSLGCGGLMGGYQLGAERLVIRPLSVLAGFCTTGHARENDLELNALIATRRQEPDGRKMILVDDKGVTWVVLER